MDDVATGIVLLFVCYRGLGHQHQCQLGYLHRDPANELKLEIYKSNIHIVSLHWTCILTKSALFAT
jgi:hypothetical protein